MVRVEGLGKSVSLKASPPLKEVATSCPAPREVVRVGKSGPLAEGGGGECEWFSRALASDEERVGKTGGDSQSLSDSVLGLSFLSTLGGDGSSGLQRLSMGGGASSNIFCLTLM